MDFGFSYITQVGGGSGAGTISGTVSTYAELPLASENSGKYYIVDTTTGTWILGTQKMAGIYKSNGSTWVYIDSVPETTSLSDGTTVITGTNIQILGSNGITTTTDVANNKITISAPTALSSLSGTNTGDETNSTIVTKLSSNLMGRNLLINPTFAINQRVYASGTATTGSNQFTFDRWFIPTTGQSLTFSTTEGLRTVTAPASGICQVIEGAFIPSGNYVLNWTGTATGYINGNQVTKGTPISITGGSNITVKFTNGTVAKPQFEKGSYATEFEVRNRTTEENLSKRYYLRVISTSDYLYSVFAIGVADSTTAVKGFLPIAISMRATPTFTSVGNWSLQGSGSTFNSHQIVTVTGMALLDNSPVGFKFSIGVASGLAVGQYYQLLAYSNATPPYLELACELTA